MEEYRGVDLTRWMKITFVLFALIIAVGCSSEQKQEKEGFDGEVELVFHMKSEYEMGEALCVRMTLYNNSPDTVCLAEFPAKSIVLLNEDGQQVQRKMRTEYALPPKMLLEPGDSSYNDLNLCGYFQNYGPGMLNKGKYCVKTIYSYYINEQCKFKQNSVSSTDSVFFEIKSADGENKQALGVYFDLLENVAPLDSLQSLQYLPQNEEIQRELDSLAFNYAHTPLGKRILINHLGIWYRSVPIERYRKFVEMDLCECNCCFERWIIDRMIKRYVIASEREEILDLVQVLVDKYPPESEVGSHVRRAFAFRVDEGGVIR